MGIWEKDRKKKRVCVRDDIYNALARVRRAIAFREFMKRGGLPFL